MSAATQFRHITERSASDRQALASILAGTKWYRGTIVVGHGTRMMAYPTGGFNSAVTAANGGPLQVPGSDADSGLRVIAKQPNVRFSNTVSGAGVAVIIRVEDTGSTLDVSVMCNTGVIAADAQRAILAHAQAASLVDVAFTGTGGSPVSNFPTPTAVPFVRLLGLANGDVDASADVADVAIDNPCDYPYTVRYGVLGLEMAAAMSAIPGPKFVTDNQTVTENYAALLLPIHCDEIDDGLAFCKFE